MSLGRKFIQSSALLLSIRTFQRGLGLLSTIILARILTPADFGIVATAMLVIYFADALADSGASQYLIQVSDIDDEVIDTAWTLDILMKSVAAVMVFCSPLILQFYWPNSSALLAIMVLAPTIALRAFQSPQLHIDARNLNYRNIFIVQTGQKFVSFIIVVIFALIYKSFWAILIGHYAGTLTTVALSWITAPRRTKLLLTNFNTQWIFSKWILGRAFFGYLRAQIDAIIISRLFSVGQFGTYSIAREIAVMPATDIVGPLTQPLLSSLSRVKNDKSAFGSQLKKAILFVSLLTLPCCAFLMERSNLLVGVLLGDKWSAAAPIISAMSPLLFSYAIGGITNNLLMSLGKVKILFWYDVISLTIVAGVLISFHNLGIINLALIRSLTGVLVTGFTFSWIARSRGISLLELLKLVSVPLVLSLIAVSTLSNYPGGGFVALAKSTIQFGITYLILVLSAMMFLRDSDKSWGYLNELLGTLKLKLIDKLSTGISRD